MRYLFLLLATSAIAQVGPNYERPENVSPPKFKGVTWRAANPSFHLPKGEWWKVFRDSKLNGCRSQYPHDEAREAEEDRSSQH